MLTPPDPAPASAPPTVLLVDDDHGVRTVTSLILRRQGFEVLLASDGQRAIDVLIEHPEVDVALLDVVMPVLSGPETLPRLRELVPDLPVVFFSGFDRNVVNDHLDNGGPFTSFLPKPYQNDELAAELRRAVAAR